MKKNKLNTKKIKSSKRNFIILVSILTFLLLLTLALNIHFYLFNRPINIHEVPVHFEISNKFGLVSTTELLDFGRMIPGNDIEKYITLENKYNFPIIIKIFLSPELEGYIFGKSQIELQPAESTDYTISLKVPSDMESGNYTGTIRFETYKAE